MSIYGKLWSGRRPLSGVIDVALQAQPPHKAEPSTRGLDPFSPELSVAQCLGCTLAAVPYSGNVLSRKANMKNERMLSNSRTFD